MTGKEYMDHRFGQPRGNGNGLASILDDFAKIKVKEETEEIRENIELIVKRSKVPLVKELAERILKKMNKSE